MIKISPNHYNGHKRVRYLYVIGVEHVPWQPVECAEVQTAAKYPIAIHGRLPARQKKTTSGTKLLHIIINHITINIGQ